MRPILAACVFAATALVASAEAGAASSVMRNQASQASTLGCEVMRAGFVDIRNSTHLTIRKGARIALVIATGDRNAEIRRTVVARQTIEPGLYHAFPLAQRNAKSCTARLENGR
jgi:hypothetical protein